MHRCLATVIGLAGVCGLAVTECRADIITVMIGDDDGFGGTQGTNSDPGDPYFNFGSPNILPGGTYVNEAGLDVATTSPYTPYVFEFSFAFDATSLASITSATVTIQSGSVARRIYLDADPELGFGHAIVTADGGSGSIGLGEFWTTSTGLRGSSDEENVKAHIFDVSALITPSSTGTLLLTVDGSALLNPGPGDQFALDFAELSIVGSPAEVPEPASLTLFGLGVLGLAAARGRRTYANL